MEVEKSKYSEVRDIIICLWIRVGQEKKIEIQDGLKVWGTAIVIHQTRNTAEVGEEIKI